MMSSYSKFRRCSSVSPALTGSISTNIGSITSRQPCRISDNAASLKTDSLFITELDAFENFKDQYLKDLRAKATDKGLQIHLGTWSICPTSRAFKDKWGSAEQHLSLGIRTAKALGSPVLRVVLGTGEDRKTEGGIEARIADTVKVCKSRRSEAIDAGVKIAV